MKPGTEDAVLEYHVKFEDGGMCTHAESELLWQVTPEEASEREARAEHGLEFSPHRVSWLAKSLQPAYEQALHTANAAEERLLGEWQAAYCSKQIMVGQQVECAASKQDLRDLRFLEIGAGSGGYSKAMHQHGWCTTLVERQPKNIKWQSPFDPFDCKVTVWDVDYTQLDASRLPCYDATHASPDCHTFSCDSAGFHRRSESNFFCGVTKAAGDANKDLELLVHLVAEQLRRNPESVFTLENPGGQGGRMRHHPLITRRLEKLPGVERFTVTYCFFGATVHKPTGQHPSQTISNRFPA